MAKTASKTGPEFGRLGRYPVFAAGTIIVLSVVLFLALNITFSLGFRSARLDLTENNLFTISAGTQEILSSIEEPISLQFFFSERLANDYPQIRTYGERIREMLESLEARAGGKLRLTLVEPAPFSESEDLAEAYGVGGAQTPNGEILYMGLVGTNTIGGRETIPFFARERAEFLEYDLASLIDNLARPEKPTLGIITSLPMEFGVGGIQAALQGRSAPLAAYEQIRERFDTVRINQDQEAIPEAVEVLLIAHPEDLSDRLLYAIDQFVLGGGRALVLVDPYSELSLVTGAPQQGIPGAPRRSDLGPLLREWGVVYNDQEIVGDLENAQVVATGRGQGLPTASFVVWHAIGSDSLSQDDPLSADIDQINIGSVGYFTPREDRETEITPLITSSPESMVIASSRMEGQPAPDSFLRGFAPTGERYLLAARVSGRAQSAFPGGPPPRAPEDEEGAPDEAGDDAGDNSIGLETGEAAGAEAGTEHRSEGVINVVLMADADIFDDRFWVQRQNLFGQSIAVPIADNGAFILNAIENLMGSSGLSTLRGRSRPDRGFDVVERLRREAEADYLAEEQRLRQRLEEREQRLAALQNTPESGAGLSSLIPTPEQQAEIEQARADIVETRAALREVQRSLRGDIEQLGSVLKFINIGLMPILVGSGAVGLAIWRRRRRMEMTFGYRSPGAGTGGRA